MDVELTNKRVVAIDGGTATGKGRLIEELAQLLRLKGVPVIHLSTGSIFRAVAYAAIASAADGVLHSPEITAAELASKALERVRDMSEEKVLELARDRHIEMHGGVVWIDGEPMIEEQLKGPSVGTGASLMGDIVGVRHWMIELVRRQINEFDGFVVIDGRDITHLVVPDAPLKLLMTVSPHIAAQRSREHTLEEIVARDTRDRARPYGQLKHPDDPGEGVIVLPTDTHTPESVRDHVYGLMRQAFPELPEL